MDDLKSNLESLELPDDVAREWIHFPGIKMFADGIPPTMTAWMNDDYVLGGHGSSVIPGNTEEEQVSIDLQGASQASLKLSHGAGRIFVGSDLATLLLNKRNVPPD